MRDTSPYLVISRLDDGSLVLDPFTVLAEAEAYAADLPAQGTACALAVILRRHKAQPAQKPDVLRGVRVGRDFPFTLFR